MTSGGRSARVLAGVALITAAALAGSGTVLLALDPGPFRGEVVVGLAGAIAGTGVGALLVARRPDNIVGRLVLGYGLVFAWGAFAQQYALRGAVGAPGSLPAVRWVAWAGEWLGESMLLFIPLVLLFFPTGRLPSTRWRPVAWTAVVAGLALVVTYMLRAGSLTIHASTGVIDLGVANPIGVPRLTRAFDVVEAIAFPLATLTILLAASSLVVRWRRASPEQRLQLKWFALAAAVAVLFIPIALAAGSFGAEPVQIAAALAGFGALYVGTPLAIGVAVLHHRLYDIDIVVNKAILFGVLAAFILTVYVALVVGVGHAIGERGGADPVLAIVATAFVAVGFQPVRERAARFASRVVYGQRATPYEAMADFARRVASTVAVDELLPHIAEAAAAAVGAARGSVRLFLRGGGERQAWWPGGSRDDAYDIRLSVQHGAETLGEIAVAKAPGDPLADGQRALLDALASQAGLALRNLRLMAELEDQVTRITAQAKELEASRRRLVAARDTVFRRLERDISVDVETHLAAVTDALQQAERAVEADPERAADMLSAAHERADRALQRLRSITRGLYPPLLADRGAVAAVRALADETSPVTIRLDIDPALEGQRVDPHVEAAVYFCCAAAVRSAARRAPGAVVSLRLQRDDDRVAFSVAGEWATDPDGEPGDSDLLDMADRIEALGGMFVVRCAAAKSTIVEGSVPIDVRDRPQDCVRASSRSHAER